MARDEVIPLLDDEEGGLWEESQRLDFFFAFQISLVAGCSEYNFPLSPSLAPLRLPFLPSRTRKPSLWFSFLSPFFPSLEFLFCVGLI